ncbi:MAG: pentapeptide repeat-containing protein [Pseudomonadota bacterium]
MSELKPPRGGETITGALDPTQGPKPPDEPKPKRSKSEQKRRKGEQHTVAAINGLKSELKSTLDDPIGRLHQSVNVAATSARNAGVTFLLFGFYLAVTFGSTSHGQLLRNDPVTVPLLNVDLPLTAFYWVAPALLVLLHLNFLMAAYLLDQKLGPLDKQISGLNGSRSQDQARDLLNPFPLVQMLVRTKQQRFAGFLINTFIWTIIAIVPIVTLIIGQSRFLPYHSNLTTGYHRALIIFDLIIIGLLWLPILDQSDRKNDQTPKTARPFSLLAGISVLRSRLRRWLDLKYWRGLRRQQIRKIYPIETLLFAVLASLSIIVSWLFMTIPNSWTGWPADRLVRPDRDIIWLLPRNLTPDEKAAVTIPLSPEVIAQAGGDETTAVLRYREGIDLRARDLRYADLTGLDLRKADLRGAQLLGANLENAQLQGADLSATRQGGTDLRFARLWRAELQGADLSNANLVGANLFNAGLEGVFAFNTDLRTANLRQARLDATYLRSADLRAADLFEAELRGVDLSGAKIEGADLRGATLDAVDMRSASFWRNRLDQSSIDKTDWTTVDGRGLRQLPSHLPVAWIEEFADNLPSFDKKKLALRRLECGFVDDETWSTLERCGSGKGLPRSASPPIETDDPPDEEKLRALLGSSVTCEILAIDVSGEQIFKRLDLDLRSNLTHPLSMLFGEVLLKDCGLIEPFDRAHESLRRQLEKAGERR